ncbi:MULTISPECIES: thylakoid membrane photosystem I accumulation factor [unclassified Pseudanabaena]|uniref:thylakoid membrane photosystem I accumulation factor n=1 Tax=unclassified Pseudanabaena TaxID=2593292 RepID=UPI000F832E58|nr:MULTISPECIES: thylakoid membrane photosystem I accumulation factor [unclassified Pseudanabaena]
MRNWLKKYFNLGLCIAIASCISLSILLGTVFGNAQPAQARLTDDTYDGNIFALYGGNGSIVPPRISLAQSLQLGRPAMVVFYVDDSADCKRFSPILNLAQGFYGKSLSLIAIPVDGLDLEKESYTPTEEAYYYKGTVPQTVLIDGDGKVSFDREGIFGFEELDTAIRDLLNLPDAPPELKFRKTDKVINELNP